MIDDNSHFSGVAWKAYIVANTSFLQKEYGANSLVLYSLFIQDKIQYSKSSFFFCAGCIWIRKPSQRIRAVSGFHKLSNRTAEDLGLRLKNVRNLQNKLILHLIVPDWTNSKIYTHLINSAKLQSGIFSNSSLISLTLPALPRCKSQYQTDRIVNDHNTWHCFHHNLCHPHMQIIYKREILIMKNYQIWEKIRK